MDEVVFMLFFSLGKQNIFQDKLSIVQIGVSHLHLLLHTSIAFLYATHIYIENLGGYLLSKPNLSH